jgi:hypothetical protein
MVVIVHSERENAASTFKRTFGLHPLGVWCDNIAAQIEVLTDAIAQIPAAHRSDRPGPATVLDTGDRCRRRDP